MAGLFLRDLALISRSLEDHVAEPRRAHLVPAFAQMKQAALRAGALGCSLSGSGPSMFALCATIEQAHQAGVAMSEAFGVATGLVADVWVSPVATRGARIVAG